MKNIVASMLFLLLIICASLAFALSPNGKKVTTLTVATTGINMAADKAMMIDTPTACQVRLKANASTSNAAATKISFRANTNTEWTINKITPFHSFSGCTNASVVRE